MKALAEQIAELDQAQIYDRVVGGARLDGRGGRAVAGDVDRCACYCRVHRSHDSVRSYRVCGLQCAADAICRPRRRAAGVSCHRKYRRNWDAPPIGWPGRVVNAMGEPIDGRSPLPSGPSPTPFRNIPPPAHARAPPPGRRAARSWGAGAQYLSDLPPGSTSRNFLRLGVGKSVLLSMLARNVAGDVAVIGLVGERGREVQESQE